MLHRPEVKRVLSLELITRKGITLRMRVTRAHVSARLISPEEGNEESEFHSNKSQ